MCSRHFLSTLYRYNTSYNNMLTFPIFYACSAAFTSIPIDYNNNIVSIFSAKRLYPRIIYKRTITRLEHNSGVRIFYSDDIRSIT